MEWLTDALEREVQTEEELSFVRPHSVAFVCAKKGLAANYDKVKATVWCYWELSRRSFKEVAVACDD